MPIKDQGTQWTGIPHCLTAPEAGKDGVIYPARNLIMDAQPSSSAAGICRICSRQYSKYTCPRCNVRYCSLECYKKHSERCTESFYRENAVNELRGVRAGDDQRQSMLKILRRVAEQDADGALGSAEGGDSDLQGSACDEDSDAESDGDSTDLSAGTLQRLLERAQAGGDLSITEGDLTEGELQAFHRAVASGAASHLVEEWDPWWYTEEARSKRLTQAGTRLVLVAEQGEGAAGNGPEGGVGDVGGVPAGPPAPLPTLKSLLHGREPSDLLRWQLLDLLYSYCHMMRRYNGEYAAETVGAVGEMLSLSDILHGHAGPDCASSRPSVLLEMMARAAGLLGPGSRAAAMLLAQDAAALVSAGRGAVVCAVWDALTAVRAALEEAAGKASMRGGPGKQEVKRLRKQLQAAARKLEFLASWANELPVAQYEALAESARSTCENLEGQLQEEASQAAARGGAGPRPPMEQLLSGMASLSVSAPPQKSAPAPKKVEVIEP
eukprot:jgi/Tetstr1/422700/TSEL_013498.t1